ncbi:hypothetical protein ACFQ0G_49635 [Streptomyces chiangmaiensis]
MAEAVPMRPLRDPHASDEDDADECAHGLLGAADGSGNGSAAAVER